MTPSNTMQLVDMKDKEEMESMERVIRVQNYLN